MKQCVSKRRIVPTTEQGLKACERGLYGLVCGLCALILLYSVGGCDTGPPRSQIPGVNQSAPPLAEFDANNNYIPYYRTGEMNTPRYLHRAVAHSSGLVWVIGGSDERGLSALDSAEFFDQSTFDDDTPPLDSMTGLWVDANIEGDPLTLLNGARVLFSMTELGNSNLLIVGGSINMATGLIHPRAERLNPSERVFSYVEGEMKTPRFRHTANLLASGDLLVAGGQILAVETVEDLTIPAGEPGREIQETFFPSTESVEYYSPTTDSFEILTLADDSLTPSNLQTRRGRSDHAVGRLAGPDNILGGSDDMFFITAGLQTLSASSTLAPDSKLPGSGGFDPQTSIEVFDPRTNIFTLIASVRLDSARLDRPFAINLGQFNDYTPDGVLGMGNCVLVTHGNAGGIACPATPWLDQIFISTYTPGAGPAQGVRFFESKEDQFLTHIQHAEYPGLIFPAAGVQVGRCATTPVVLPRNVEPLAQGVSATQSWVFSLAGVDIFATPGGCSFNHSSPAMLAGCVFDPFYNVPIAFNNLLPPRDMVNARRANPQNFLGVVGAWFTIDGFLDETIDSWGSTNPIRWPENHGQQRAYTICTPVAGVDGRLGSFDDRILLTGGGRAYQSQGGEPTQPSAEIFLPPGSATFNDN